MAVTANVPSGQWNHAVSMDDDSGYTSRNRADTHSSQEVPKPTQKTIGKRPSGYGMYSEDERPRQVRRPSGQSNHSAAARKKSAQALRQPKYVEEPLDNSAWIHRDKLAQIEIQEMADLGYRVEQSRRSLSAGPGAKAGSGSRSASRTELRRPKSKEQLHEPVEDDSGYEQPVRKQRISTVPDEEEREFDPAVDAEIRTPEEVAASEAMYYRQHTVRPSTSRIPISKASPAPVSANVLERDSPLPRTRHGSEGWSGQWDELRYTRGVRSGSIGSQVMLDEGDGIRTPSRPASSHLRSSPEDNSPHSRSPPKARMPNRDGPVSGARKASALSQSTARPGSSSGKQGSRLTSPNSRPGSSAGSKGRPSSSLNRPEGDAPWLATMYKPDPRLPPDQQMLPTHAKRLMQEQSLRSSSLPNDDPAGSDAAKHRPQPLNLSPQKGNQNQYRDPDLLTPTRIPMPSPGARENMSPHRINSWRMSSASAGAKSTAGSVRPGTSGGYRITPTISHTPVISIQPGGLAGVSTTVGGAEGTKMNATPRVPDFDEKEEGKKQEKGCLGCVVM